VNPWQRTLSLPALCESMRKRWPFLVAAPRHMAKKKSFRSGPTIVTGRDNDRCTLLIRLVSAMLLPAGHRCFRCREKPRQEVRCRDGHSDAERHPGKHTLRAAFTEGAGEPGHDNRNQGQPPCNRARKRLLQDAHGVFPRGLATHCTNAADARIRDVENATEADLSQRETDFFGRLSSLPASSFQRMRAGHRTGIRKGNLSPDLVGRDGERREPKVEGAASRREAAPMEPHEYAQSPVAESRMLSASSDQGQSCCHFPSLLVGEKSSESRLLILLMGKKPAKSFKEKCFTF
jgi:hypothetical protein